MIYILILIIILITLIHTTFKLELSANKCIEKGCDNNKLVRFSSKNFKANPFKEIRRYIEDVNYYNNIWRISALCASIITLLLLIPVIITNINIPIWIFFPFTWILIFTVCYHIWHFKYHHFHNYVYKSLKESMTYLEYIPRLTNTINNMIKTEEPYKQTIHP
jgi:hypothetical protein